MLLLTSLGRDLAFTHPHSNLLKWRLSLHTKLFLLFKDIMHIGSPSPTQGYWRPSSKYLPPKDLPRFLNRDPSSAIPESCKISSERRMGWPLTRIHSREYPQAPSAPINASHSRCVTSSKWILTTSLCPRFRPLSYSCLSAQPPRTGSSTSPSNAARCVPLPVSSPLNSTTTAPASGPEAYLQWLVQYERLMESSQWWLWRHYTGLHQRIPAPRQLLGRCLSRHLCIDTKASRSSTFWEFGCGLEDLDWDVRMV